MQYIINIWLFIQNQLLGMKWLKYIVGELLTAAGVDISNRIGGSIQFFIYDLIKVFSLLICLFFIISYVQSYFPPERAQKIIANFHGFWAILIAAIFGIMTPFCSCSSILLFIGFTSAGLPFAATITFLIASPLADLGSVILLMGILGFEVGLWYVIAVMIFAILGGILFDRIKMEKYLKKDFIKLTGIADLDTMNITWRERVRYARDQVEIAYNRMFWYIVVDVAIAAAIHNWIPTDLIHATLGSENKFAVALASLMGIPMYADVYGTLPIAEALFDQGVQIGTIIAFIMSVTAISIPALMMMKKVVKPQLLYAFVTFVVVGIIFIGYLFNYFYYPEIPSEIYPMYFGM